MPFDLFIALGAIVAPLVGAHAERTIIERLDTEILDEIHACVRRVRIRSIAFGGANQPSSPSATICEGFSDFM